MKVVQIWISPAHNYFGHHGQEPGRAPMEEVKSVECIAGKGLMGDRFFDFKENYKGQITFFSQEVYEALSQKFSVADKAAWVFRRNVLVSGVDLNSLIGKQFELQGITFEGACECTPCYWMDEAFCPGAHDALAGNGGLRARILTDGVLKAEA